MGFVLKLTQNTLTSVHSISRYSPLMLPTICSGLLHFSKHSTSLYYSLVKKELLQLFKKQLVNRPASELLLQPIQLMFSIVVVSACVFVRKVHRKRIFRRAGRKISYSNLHLPMKHAILRLKAIVYRFLIIHNTNVLLFICSKPPS